MSLKYLVALAGAAALLVTAGCASEELSSSTVAVTKPAAGQDVEYGAVTTASSPKKSTTTTSNSQAPARDPDAWKSDVIARVSVAWDGGDSGGAGGRTAISDDGRFVTFESSADDLVPGDTNRAGRKAVCREVPAAVQSGADIFVLDRQTGVMERVSVATGGAQGNGDSTFPFISAGGRWVVFGSAADNLVPGDTNKHTDAFLHDRETGVTELVSVGLDGGPADGGSTAYGVSEDGRYVLFGSAATNLVEGDANKLGDIFLRDRQSGTTELVNVSEDGEQADKETAECTLSRDGRYVAFKSYAGNLVPGDTNHLADIFVRDLGNGATERVSVNGKGQQANDNSWDVSITAHGRYVAFTSAATNLVAGDTSHQRNDAFVYDRHTKTITCISMRADGAWGNNSSGSPSLSADGRYAAFSSFARNFAAKDTNGWSDLFIRDLETGKIWMVSLTAKGKQATDGSPYLALSGDGRWVAFMSHANNLVSGDRNRTCDIFVTKARR